MTMHQVLLAKADPEAGKWHIIHPDMIEVCQMAGDLLRTPAAVHTLRATIVFGTDRPNVLHWSHGPDVLNDDTLCQDCASGARQAINTIETRDLLYGHN